MNIIHRCIMNAPPGRDRTPNDPPLDIADPRYGADSVPRRIQRSVRLVPTTFRIKWLQRQLSCRFVTRSVSCRGEAANDEVVKR